MSGKLEDLCLGSGVHKEVLYLSPWENQESSGSNRFTAQIVLTSCVEWGSVWDICWGKGIHMDSVFIKNLGVFWEGRPLRKEIEA